MTHGPGRTADLVVAVCSCVGYALAGLAIAVLLLFDTTSEGLDGLGSALVAVAVFFVAALLAVLCGLAAGVVLLVRLTRFGATGMRPVTPLLAAPLVAGSLWLTLLRLINGP